MRKKGVAAIRSIGLVLAFLLALMWGAGVSKGGDREGHSLPPGYTGSVTCRECHEKFYKLWAPSHHGLAMQPYIAEFARRELKPQTQDIVIDSYVYRAEVTGEAGWVVEKGPQGEKKYPMVHAMGGKNVYYFLTPMERGRLQTLPVAYDVRREEWFDTAASGVRHFPNREGEDEPVNWKEWPYTFNTACFNCHVSQLSSNYDLKTDTYHTTWAEPGINCETCHGPADEHIRVCREAPPGQVPKDLKITRGGRTFTGEQNNDSCATCHAKMSPVTNSFQPGNRFFDHFDLVALESSDFYPDGRDLGENYTYTSWRMSPCVQSGQISCLHCHTSSGRFRQKDNPNEACLPCHRERVEKAAVHTRHADGSSGSKCISCHMVMTEFARMRRSDHSMLPPTPAATIAFNSPNACNVCHPDKDAAWADRLVRQWHPRDYQAPLLKRAGLVEAARKREWKQVSDMLAYIEGKDRDEVFTASLMRLLGGYDDPSKWPVILRAMKDSSPLVRSAAAAALGSALSRETAEVLIEATRDEYRLVRVRAAASLAGYPTLISDDQGRQSVEKATAEYLQSLLSRPDYWHSHYNLGNYYLNRGEDQKAVAAYETAANLEPGSPLPLVNASIAYARMGQNQRAEDGIRSALKIDPDNAVAHFNMGLLKAEQNNPEKAESHLREALRLDPFMAEAAFNLGILLAGRQKGESLRMLIRAFDLRPQPRYGYTVAYYELENGNSERSAALLQTLLQQWPSYVDAILLLGSIYEHEGKTKRAQDLYSEALKNDGLSMKDQYHLKLRINALSGNRE